MLRKSCKLTLFFFVWLHAPSPVLFEVRTVNHTYSPMFRPNIDIGFLLSQHPLDAVSGPSTARHPSPFKKAQRFSGPLLPLQPTVPPQCVTYHNSNIFLLFHTHCVICRVPAGATRIMDTSTQPNCVVVNSLRVAYAMTLLQRLYCLKPPQLRVTETHISSKGCFHHFPVL
jgi:hypothetical protein